MSPANAEIKYHTNPPDTKHLAFGAEPGKRSIPGTALDLVWTGDKAEHVGIAIATLNLILPESAEPLFDIGDTATYRLGPNDPNYGPKDLITVTVTRT